MSGIPNNKKIWETRRKNGTTSSWTKTKHHSMEARAKIKEARAKQVITEEHKENLKKSRKNRVFTSETRENMSKALRGEKCYAWKGGVTKVHKQIRDSFVYRQWRSDCFTRDDFTCQFCFKRGSSLQVDHIKPFSFIIKENNIKSLEDALVCEELWNINNGRTLCIECHRKTETWGAGSKNLLYKE